MYQLTLFNMVQPDAPSLKALREKPGDRVLSGAPEPSLLDLLSVLLGNPDLALHLLSKYPTLAELARVSPAELQRIKGIGRCNVARIKAALELGRRALTASLDERPQIKSPTDAAMLFLSKMIGHEQEELHVMILDTRNRVLGIYPIYKGSLNATSVRVSELFRDAIRSSGAAILIAHSHPSGDPSPSPEDVSLTREVFQAGKLLSIDLLDHIVVGSGGHWISLRERDLGFDL